MQRNLIQFELISRCLFNVRNDRDTREAAICTRMGIEFPELPMDEIRQMVAEQLKCLDDRVRAFEKRIAHQCLEELLENHSKLLENGSLSRLSEPDLGDVIDILPVPSSCNQETQTIFLEDMESCAVDAIDDSATEEVAEDDSSTNTKKDRTIEREAMMEAQVLQRVAELRKHGLWTDSRLPICVDPPRNKTHWDYLLEEVRWMATDFRQERNFKINMARKISTAVAKQKREQELELEKAQQRNIKKEKKSCAYVAKIVRNFWKNIGRVAGHRAQEILETKKREALDQQLSFIVGEADKLSTLVREGLNQKALPDTIDVDLGSASSDSSSKSLSEHTTVQEENNSYSHYRNELIELNNEAEKNLDDFLAELPPEYLASLGIELPTEHKDSEGYLPNSDEQDDDVLDSGGKRNGRGVLDDVDYAKLNSSNADEREKELTHIAEQALLLQPKGFTLLTTQVKTQVPSLLRGNLREYQMVGLDWLVTLYQKNLNGILADEMGLGKTIQTISLLAYLASSEFIWGHHLIIVPTSVILNWEMEFKKWCPALKILTYFGSVKERAEKRKGWLKANTFDVCITSYQMITSDIRAFKRKSWQYLILDEAHNIKNWKSRRWQSLLNIRARRRLLLTGTPLQNSLMELWSLMHFLMPSIFSSREDFNDWFSNPITGMMEGNVEYSAPLIQRLHKILRPFILRRLKSEVEKQLPEKTETVVKCGLSKRQRYLYDDFMSRRSTKENLKSGSMCSVLQIIIQLRKCCNHPNLFEPRPVLSPFVMAPIKKAYPSIIFNLSGNDSDVINIPECFDIRKRLLGSNACTSFKKPKIKELRKINDFESPPKVDGFCLAIPTVSHTVASNGEATISKMRIIRVKSSDFVSEIHEGKKMEYIEPTFKSVTKIYPAVCNDVEVDGFNYEMANGGLRENIFDLNYQFSAPLKQKKQVVPPLVSGMYSDRVPQDYLDYLLSEKKRRLRLARDRFIQQKPIFDHYMMDFVQVCFNKQELVDVETKLKNHTALLLNKFAVYCEAVLSDSPSVTATSSGRSCVSKQSEMELNRTARKYLRESPFELNSQLLSNKLQFPEARLIEYDCGKLQALATLLRKLYLFNHRCLIFTQMSRMLDILQAFLSHHGYQYFRLDGTTGIEQRQIMMEKFNSDPRIFCFILSTRSGGLGINLTGADTVIFYDSDWNPTMDAQAQDRCHRIGQTRNVTIYRLISERTIEENILKKAMQKRRLGEMAIDNAGFTPEFFKKTDNLRDLFNNADLEIQSDTESAKNQEELNQIMASLEDEQDVAATQLAAAEAKADKAEFDDAKKDNALELYIGESQHEKDVELIDQLKPIERYALQFLEAEYKPEFDEERTRIKTATRQKKEKCVQASESSFLDRPVEDHDFYGCGSALDKVRFRRRTTDSVPKRVSNRVSKPRRHIYSSVSFSVRGTVKPTSQRVGSSLRGKLIKRTKRWNTSSTQSATHAPRMAEGEDVIRRPKKSCGRIARASKNCSTTSACTNKKDIRANVERRTQGRGPVGYRRPRLFLGRDDPQDEVTI